jgi:hypothetical protein
MTLFKHAGAGHLSSQRGPEDGGGLEAHATVESGIGPLYYQDATGPLWRFTPDASDNGAGGKRGRAGKLALSGAALAGASGSVCVAWEGDVAPAGPGVVESDADRIAAIRELALGLQAARPPRPLVLSGHAASLTRY